MRQTLSEKQGRRGTGDSERINLGGRQTEFRFTDEDFNFVVRLIREHAGINLGVRKQSMVYSRLARRLRELGLGSFQEYREILSRNDREELGRFTNALTTNLTRFFRESHHFDHLRDAVLADVARQGGKPPRRLRIWSAGCSSGEEPYSIAMTLSEWMEKQKRREWDAKILATDLDTNMLDRCRAGIYKGTTLRDLSENYRNRFMEKGELGPDGEMQWHAGAEVRSYLTFKQLNLLGPWPMKGPFDVIFCRNVLIYFEKETQARLAERFADLLKPGGWLYLGHSENLYKLTDRFTLLGRTIYQRVS